MNAVPSLRCGEPLCKKPVSLPDGAVNPWPVRCDSCGRYLYPHEVLESALIGKELETHRAQLMRVVNGKLVSCSTDDMQRWFEAKHLKRRAAAPKIDIFDMVEVAPPAAESPASVVHAPIPIADPIQRAAADLPVAIVHVPPTQMPPEPSGVYCYRDGDTLLLFQGEETYVAFPDRCVICNVHVPRAFFEHNQKSVLRRNFYLQRTTFWTPWSRYYQERSIDVEFTVCDTRRAHRWLSLLWMIAAAVAAAAPVVALNLRLLSDDSLGALMIGCWIGAGLFFWKGTRSFSYMVLQEIGPRMARFRVGQPFLESFPEKTVRG